MSPMNDWDWDSGSTAAVMLIRPVKRIPKPIAMPPMVLEFFVLMNMISMMPTTAATGARVSGFRKFSHRVLAEEVLRSSRRMI